MRNNLLHILMIDDSTEDVFMVERLLRSEGMKVVIKQVANSTTMKEAIKNKKPDIILVDRNGIPFDVKNILKKQQWNFIAFSGIDTSETRDGAMAFVNKNDVSVLPAVVKTAVKISEEEKKALEVCDKLSKKIDVIASKIKKKKV
jgi:DNA-binding NtrC family response regulator